MNILVLNSIFADALRAQNIPFEALMDFDVFTKSFSYDDFEIIGAQTKLFIERFNRRGVAGKALNLHYRYGSGETTDAVSPVDSMDYLTAEQKTDLYADIQDHLYTLKCCAVDANNVILYADSTSTEDGRSTLENIFCALALIMPVDEVLKTDLYGRFVQL